MGAYGAGVFAKVYFGVDGWPICICVGEVRMVSFISKQQMSVSHFSIHSQDKKFCKRNQESLTVISGTFAKVVIEFAVSTYSAHLHYASAPPATST